VAIDAGNARAYVGLADVAMLSTRYLREPRTEGLRASHRFVDKALELDPNLAEAHASRGSLFAREFRWSEAEQEFRRALAVNPSYATAHQEYAILLGDEGRLDEAVREMALAEEADPVSLILLAHFMQLLIGLGRLDEARAKLVRVGEIEGSAGAVFHECAAIYSLFTSDLASAREHVDWLKANVPEDPDTDLWYGMYTGLTHDRENAERAINQLEGLQDSYALRDQSIATVYALLGDWDECFAWLERGLKKRDLLVLRLRWNPLLTPVRKDPRFHDLLRRAQLQ
jgi:tetratricopeptide (TPR) repeat protein